MVIFYSYISLPEGTIDEFQYMGFSENCLDAPKSNQQKKHLDPILKNGHILGGQSLVFRYAHSILLKQLHALSDII